MSDPIYQSSEAIRRMEYALAEPLEEGDDEQSELDARLLAEDMAWERMKQEKGI